MKQKLIIGGIVLAAILLIVVALFSTRNHAITLEENVAQAESAIKVQEKRRFDLIPNLVDCVQEYDKHEYETLLAVINARTSLTDGDVNEIKTAINAVAEAYPELKSNENYKQLMTELATTENLIANHRDGYNYSVRQYNQYLRKFPNSMFLNITGYTAVNYTYLEYENVEEGLTNLFG